MGRESVSPLITEPIVPSQKASTSSSLTWADPRASVAASISRSSALLSHRSPNSVHPIPTIATRSRIPLDAMSLTLLDGSCLPKIVVDAVGSREQASKGHLDPIADLDRCGVDVGQLAAQPSAAVEVDD